MATKRSNKSNILKEKLITELEKSLGIVTMACKNAGCSRKTFYQYCNTDEDFRKRVEEIEDMAIDFVESKLFEQIKEKNTTATIFYLKTKAKKRGYVERQEVEHTGVQPIQIEVSKDTADNLNKLLNDNNDDESI